MLTYSARAFGRRTLRGVALIAAVAGLFAAGGTVAAAEPGTAGGDWTSAGQNIYDTHNQPFEHEISSANVGGLTPRWTLTTAGGLSAPPTAACRVLVVPRFV